MTPADERWSAEPARTLRDVSVVDTTELRWFAHEPLPAAVGSWFTEHGRLGAVEERCDTYFLDGRPDVGLKLRFRTTLELKVLQSYDGQLRLGPELAGRLECWRKWSPAHDLATATDGARWVDVHKTVTKRRFSAEGDELVIDGGAGPTEAACDVEVVSVRVERLVAWTFAFAAVGPVAGRAASMVAAWDALRDGREPPTRFGRSLGVSTGYPRWLTQAATRRAPVPSGA